MSVVMPFAGDAGDAAVALRALSAIERRPGDELIVADNSAGLTLSAIAAGWPAVRVLSAAGQRSSYYARNVAAAAAGNEWLLFMDSDCVPEPAILERYFALQISADEGAVAGEIVGDPAQRHVLARYQRDRGYLSQRRNVEDPRRPYAVTANLLVRRRAWQSIGGFLEGIRSGGDSEFTWRLQDVGWRLGYRPEARVVHRHRDTLRSFARVTARYAAGRAWLNRRYPGAHPPSPTLAPALRALAAAAFWLGRGERERGRFRAIDALVIVIGRVGRAYGNASSQPERLRVQTRVAVLADTFPEISETFIGGELRGLARAGYPGRVEAARRARRQDIAAVREHRVDFGEDDPPPGKLVALLWLTARHPLRCTADLLTRGRWAREEPVAPLRVIAPAARRLARGHERHLHAHFAGSAALTALRLARLGGRSYSVTAHGYDIFRDPRNLAEKLESAAFVATGCAYNAEHLRGLVPRARVHEIVMGVDGVRFTRQTPYPGCRRIVAVGRLVEKKGFAHLIDAIAVLERIAPVDGLEIVGDGPLRDQLAAQVKRLGLRGKVRLLGALEHDFVRIALERADLLAMPCVVAADGDRDSMPVVVKEALALEIPVVGSDEVGLPEVIEPAWGRLVPPADPQALAEAIAALLALGPDERMRMGRAGRAHVLEHCSIDQESARLAHLIDQSTSIRWRTEARTIAPTSTASSSG